MLYYGCFPRGRQNKDKDKREDKAMEVKTFKVGTRVHMNDEPEANSGTITMLGGSRARVSWDNGNTTDESLFSLTPIIPDTPRTRVANLIAHWRKPVTKADLAAVRSVVNDAIAACGLDATATVEEDKGYNCDTLGYNPIKAVIKIKGAYPAVRLANGTLVKGMDTITVQFCRKVGLYDYEAYGKRKDEEAAIFRDMDDNEEAKRLIDALPWDAELVDFSARTNGKARDYRMRHWYPYEGGIAGYGLDHIGGHFGYADTWGNLAEDFAAYVRAVAHDLGYEGLAVRREVA